MGSGSRLIIRAAIAGFVSLLALGSLPGSVPAPLEAQVGIGQGERIDARLLTNTDDEEPPSPVQFAALDEISRQVGGRPQAGFNPLNGTPRVLFARGSFLSEPSADPPRAIARNFLLDHADLFVVSPQFVSRLAESRVFKNENSGITHVQYEQRYGGLEVFQSTVRIAVTAEGRVLMVTADYYPELSLPTTDPVLSKEAAMDAAFAEVGPPRDLPPQKTDPDPMTASMRDLYTPTAELVVFPLPNKSAALAWRVVVPQSIDMWEVVVDADSGDILYVGNLTNDHEEGQVFLEHPDAGSQVPVPFTGSLPAPRDAWVGSNVYTGCTTCTAGNNGLAIEDRDDDGSGFLASDPHPNFSFGFADSYALTGNPNADEDTSITNLFYLTNVAHDHFYQLGFTEAAGNFQDDNFGAGGVDSDPVFATTYTGWDSCSWPPLDFDCRNNAWFSTPPDGTAGIMQTFLFTDPPLAQRDPSFDGDIVIHEYGHGVTNRLVDVGTLDGDQSGAMGEGWSDYFPISFYDDPIVGEYGTQNPTTGIRRYAYDNNPLTYGDLCAGGCQVHNDGEIWGATLWDLRALYISQLGLAAGSERADELVIEGLMLTPTYPSMLDARDAILQAEVAMPGANQCAVWQVFADRGMGDSATSAGDTGSVSEAFDLPAACLGAVPPCDYNGDGFADLAIGVPEEDIGTIRDAGAVNVLYGSGGRLTATGDQIWHQNTAGVTGGAEAGDMFGSVIACGDFNGDKFDDLAIGVPGEDIGAIKDAGAVNVLYGSGVRLTATGDQIWHQNSPGILGGAEAGDVFGDSLASGDLNGDDKDDLAIGVPGEDIGAIVDAGAVNVLYGSGGRLTATGNQIWHQNSPGILGGAEAGDVFGDSLASGDLNGDDKDDLAIGAPGEDIRAIVDAGAVNVLYGSGARLTASGDQLWHQNTAGVTGGAEAGDVFGYSLVSGNFNGDNEDDLAIGAPGEDIGAIVEAGAVNVLYGSGGRLTASGDQLWHQNTAGVTGGAEAGDVFGYSLASGDLNGDDKDDLAIGVPGEDIGAIVEAGAVNVLYGSGVRLTATGNQIWHQNSPGILGGAEAGDLMGFSLGKRPSD